MIQNRPNLCFATFTTASCTLLKYNTIKGNYQSRNEAKRQQPITTHHEDENGEQNDVYRLHKADAAAAPAARPASNAGVATSAAVADARADSKSYC